MKTIFNCILNHSDKLNLKADKEIQSEIKRYLQNKCSKRNKSYLSVLIDGHEIFLGEVNRDLSSASLKDADFMYGVADILRNYVSETDIDNEDAFKEIFSDCRWTFRYIVNPETEGSCMSWHTDVLVGARDHWLSIGCVNYCPTPGCFTGEWLDYWYDRKRYFAA